ncbi:MAG TPA: hypothetical protein VFH99_00265 [Candidatus Saccharimonadales bacterium]|nr:hypothetical protein [Candidatus Saccharimonadales bacterium]
MANKPNEPTLNDIARSIADLKATVVLKGDLDGLAAKADVIKVQSTMATKDDLEKIETTMATKNELAQIEATMATKDSLSKLESAMATRQGDLAAAIERLEKTIRREAGDLGESISSLANMVDGRFSGVNARLDNLETGTGSTWRKYKIR